MRANGFGGLGSWMAAGLALVGTILSAEANEPPPIKQPAAQQQAAQPKPAQPAKTEPAPSGHELFTREWLPSDARAHGGDGLGPVFNDSSCVACHNQGGTGGAGPTSKNVDILSASLVPQAQPELNQPGFALALFDSLFGSLAPRPTAANPAVPLNAQQQKLARQREKESLGRVHPGFATSRSLVLHHFGTDPKYQEWRTTLLSGQSAEQSALQEAPESGIPAPQSPEAVASPALPTSGVPTPNPAQVAAAIAVPQQATAAPAPASENHVNPPPDEPVVTQSPVLSEVASEEAPPPIQNEMVQLQTLAQAQHADAFAGAFQVGSAQITRSQRNPTALFGVGLIDAIPQQAILDLAQVEAKEYPKVAGRPSKQKDGRIGRFGWKAQKPTLQDFALTACAVELGLNVPGHEQAGVPLKPDYKAPGLDMNQPECVALVDYLKALPAPIERKPATEQEAAVIAAGHKLFAATGCANCHVEKLGATTGIYSDLLLHDMGPGLGDTGNYGVFTPNSPEEEQTELPSQQASAGDSADPSEVKLTPAQLAKVVGALRQEWRTPPLWGVRDSGPYLHDGRADTFEQAIAFHGGQGSAAAIKFFELKPQGRQQLISFLKSLTAPGQAALERSETVSSPSSPDQYRDGKRLSSIARSSTP